MRSSSVCEVNELHCGLVSSDVWVGGGDTCRAVLEEVRGVMIWVKVRFVYEILERFVPSCCVVEFFNRELNQLKQRNEMNEPKFL